MASSPITSWQIVVEKWKQCQILFSWAPKSLQMVTAAMKLKDTCSLDKPRQLIKKQSHYFANKGLERLLLKEKTLGFLASRGEEFNPGPETRLDRSELFV